MNISRLTSRVGIDPTSPALSELPSAWRSRAADLRRWGSAEGAAAALECAAGQLEDALRLEGDPLLNVAQAAELTGRHRDTIGGALRTGRLTNCGEKHRPRVRRNELLRLFPATSVAGDANLAYDPVADARSILGTRRGGK